MGVKASQRAWLIHDASSALVHKTKELEAAIEQGQLLDLGHLVGSPRYQAAANNYFLAYPLQLVFHNIGWYLGLEYFTGKQQGLLKFERVDRLLLGNKQSWQRSRSEQLISLEKLQKLYSDPKSYVKSELR